MKDPYLHIEDYVKGHLSEEDRLHFEFAMTTDEQLKQSVEDFDLVELIGETLIEEEIAGIVREEIVRSEVEVIDNKKYKWSRWLLLFIILSMLLSSAYKLHIKTQQKEKWLIALNEYTPPQVTFTRGSELSNLDSLELAKELFGKRDFQASKLILEALDDNKTNTIDWLLAHIYFIQGDLDRSQEKFNKTKVLFDYKKDSEQMLIKIYPLTI